MDKIIATLNDNKSNIAFCQNIITSESTDELIRQLDELTQNGNKIFSLNSIVLYERELR